MLKLVLLGAVDSGKTTFFRRYFKERLVQKAQRTQNIRVLETTLGSTKVNLLDCPGHQSLLKFRQIAATMADLIVYVVDASKLDLSMVYLLEGKPCVVVLNKVDLCEFYKSFKGLSLKQTVSSPEHRSRLYYEFSKLLKDHPTLAPFLDNDPQKHVCFPLSLKEGFGSAQFESFLDKYYLKNLKLEETTYLYAQLMDQKRKEFVMVGQPGPNPVINLNGITRALNQWFDYNPTKNRYLLKTSFFNELGPQVEILRVYSAPDVRDSKVPLMFLKDDYEVPQPLVQLVKEKQCLKDFKFLVSSKNSYKHQCLCEVLKKLNLNVEKTHLTASQLKRVKNPKEVVLEWTQTPFGSEDLTFSRDSFHELMEDLELFLKTQNQRYHKFLSNEIVTQCIAQLLSTHVFKQDKNELVIGCKLMFGTLNSETEVELVSKTKKEVLKVRLDSIKEETRAYSKWVDTKKSCAIKLSGKDVPRILKDNFLFLRNLGLENYVKRDLLHEDFKLLKRSYVSVFSELGQ